ncbi:MAG: response regulator [Candidatus Binatia bacterium]
MSILLVDDDDGFRYGLAENLRDDGHEVWEFSDPTQVSIGSLDGVDLVVTDQMMLHEDGLSFAQRVHALRPRLPIILVTACGIDHVEQMARRSGYISLLHKPFDYARVERLVGELTRRPATA